MIKNKDFILTVYTTSKTFDKDLRNYLTDNGFSFTQDITTVDGCQESVINVLYLNSNDLLHVLNYLNESKEIYFIYITGKGGI